MLKQWKRHRRFEQLMQPHIPSLRRFAQKLEKSSADAEDLLQESLLIGLMRIDQLQADAAARVWISRVLYRTFLNRCRKRQSQHGQWSDQADQTVIPFPSPDARLEDKRLAGRVASAMDRLPAKQRQAIWLVDGQGFKFSEAAEVLGVRPGTIASRVARGRAALRQDLAQLARERGVIS